MTDTKRNAGVLAGTPAQTTDHISCNENSTRRADPVNWAALDYALAYAALGWPVLPIRARTKLPAGGQGLKHATTDTNTIRGWFKRWPDAGVGVSLEAAGLCAIDIDPRNGTTKTPADYPATLTARTGGGGWHLIYRAPPGLALPGKLNPGVDIKHRGYIIVEPSIHPNGVRYEWQDWRPLADNMLGGDLV